MRKKISALRCVRGQVLVFFALMIPLLFIFVGAAFDFGWWYLNQSRLQNAADAAVVAGAHKIISDGEKKLIHYTQVDFISENDETYAKFLKPKQTSNLERITDAEAQKYVSYVDAEKYALENMPDMSSIKLDEPVARLARDSKLITEHIYYSVELSGTVEHMFGFMQNQFGSMPIKAVALTRLTQVLDGEALLPQVNLLKDGKKDDHDKIITPAKVIYDWERSGSSYSNPRTVRTTNGTDNKSRQIDYKTGNTYRTENIVLDGSTGYNAGSANMSNTGDGYWRQYAASVKNGKYEMDDMFIDFRPDINYNSDASKGNIFTEDWDITMDAPSGLSYSNLSETKKSVKLRILSTIDFSEPYEVRANKDTNGNEIKDSQGNSLLPSDPLYIRIESEPIYNDGITSGHSSVRQIIININAASDDPTGYNTKKDLLGNYKYRPLVIFYDGPEKLTGSTSTVRDSKPVIINLNADFRGIIVMQNSPVVINGNGHKFYGFVIAKEYKHTKTADDDVDTLDSIIEDFNATLAANKILYVDSDGKLCTIDKTSNVKDASNYNTTDYIRANKKFNGSADGNKGKAVYILNGAVLGTTETTNWYEFTTRDAPEQSKYCLDGRDTKILLSYEGWTIIEDVNGKNWIVKKPDTLKTLYDVSFYTKYMMNDTNYVYVDQKGEIGYREGSYTDSKTGVQYKNGAIVPSMNNTGYEVYGNFLRDADKKIFNYRRDFNLSDSKYDAFEGVVNPRGIYRYLDDEDDDSHDNFFTTERAEWIT